MSPTADLPVHHFEGRDGVRLAYRELGEGRPLVLIHGFFSTGYVNWVKYGHAARLAQAGHRVLMPDLRGHGDSARPHDEASYPADVLTDDGFAFLEHVGVEEGEYDLGGYSLGGRTTLRMLVRGATPRRAVIAGMGLDGMTATGPSVRDFERVLDGYGTFRHGDPEFLAQAFLKTVGGDPEALRHVIRSSVDTAQADIEEVTTPTLVLLGDEDDDHGSGEALAEVLPHGSFAKIPGTHMGAVTKKELGQEIATFLARDEEKVTA